MGGFAKALIVAVALITTSFLSSGRLFASGSLTVASDPALGNPSTVTEGSDSVLTYSLSYSVGPNSEGVTPSVKSIELIFEAQGGALIDQSYANGVISGGGTVETVILTSGLKSPMAVTCNAYSEADGVFPVSCVAVLNLSDGENIPGNLALDYFAVAKMAVNVSGDPYVIIPANGTPGPDTESNYQASAAENNSFGDTLVYAWSIPSNITIVEGFGYNPNSPSVEVYGASDPGPAVIACTVNDQNSGAAGAGQKSVTVADEFVTKMDPPARLVYGTWTELSPTQTEPLGGGVPLSWTVTGSVSATIGVTVTGGFNAGFVAAQVSGTVATTVTLGISATAAVINPVPGQEYAEWGRTKRNELTGTETQWAPSGLVKTGQITEWTWANGGYNLEIGGGNTAPPS